MRNSYCGHFLHIVAIIFLLTGCSIFTEYGRLEDSARKAYIAGYYDSAVFDVVASLKLNQNYEDAQELVKAVIPKAIDAHVNKLKELNSSNVKFKWDSIASEYEAFIKLNQVISSLPPITEKKTKQAITFNTTDYSKELSEAKTNAAEAHYQEGVLLSKKGTSTREQAANEFTTANKYVSGYKDALALAADGYYREGLRLKKQDNVNSQKQAAKEFKTAMSFVPNYKDSDSLYETSRKAGVKRVAVIPFEDKSGKGSKYGAVADTVADQIVSMIMNDQNAMEFLEIISRDRLEHVMREQNLGRTGIMNEKTAISLGKVLGVHEIITGKITGINYTPERTTNRNVKQNAQVAVGERVVGYDKKGREKTETVWGTVTAIATLYTRTAGVSINGSYNIVDVKTAKVLKTKAITGKTDFKSEWGKFSGDERALSGEVKTLCGKAEEAPPSEDELVNNTAKNISESLATEIITYAK